MDDNVDQHRHGGEKESFIWDWRNFVYGWSDIHRAGVCRTQGGIVMGMIRILSSSSYDEPQNLPNPVPVNYRIVRYLQLNNFLIVKIRYPDCTNYEGDKILVYKNTSIKRLERQGSIDPHFSDNPNMISPVARFVPTVDGWNMAVFFCGVFTE